MGRLKICAGLRQGCLVKLGVPFEDEGRRLAGGLPFARTEQAWGSHSLSQVNLPPIS